MTADQKLLRIIREDSTLHRASGTVISQIGLVGLVDVIVGLEADSRSLARLVWSDPHTDEQESLFQYFIRLGLEDYEVGLDLDIHDLASRLASEAASEADERHIDLFANDIDDVTRAAEFIDRYEERFFKNWRAAKEESAKRSSAK